MAGWYRRPKRLDLHRVIYQSDFTFVIEAVQPISEAIGEAHASCSGRIAPEKFRTDVMSESKQDRILLCYVGVSEQDLHARLAEGWRGIICLPREKAEREKVLHNFFSVQRRYRLGQQCSKVNLRTPIQPFVLDLSISPGVITAIKAG